MLEPELVLDDAARERLVSRFGDAAREWCAALPELIGRCCSRWDLRLEDAQSGSTSRVYCGRQHGRREVVLKLTPDLAIAREEAVALRAWAGTRTPSPCSTRTWTSGRCCWSGSGREPSSGTQPGRPPPARWPSC